MKILLVEDNVSLCRNIASVLQNEGYTVVTCSNGNEAEFQMLNNSSDLILLDRMLPGKDGITLTREARAAGITVPILLLTALDTLGDKVTGLDAGADDYIVKPFAMEELLARLRIWSRRTVSLEDPGELCFGDLSYRPSVRQLSGPCREGSPAQTAGPIDRTTAAKCRSAHYSQRNLQPHLGTGRGSDRCCHRHLYPSDTAAARAPAIRRENTKQPGHRLPTVL